MKVSSLPDVLVFFRTTTRERWDWATPLALLCLSAIGVAFIYSAQYSAWLAAPPNESLLVWLARSYWIKQCAFLAVGAGIYTVVSLIDYRHWLNAAHWFYLFCVIPLALVLLPGIGSAAGGSQRWLRLGFIRFQPSEPAKIAVLLITASILIRSKVGTIQQSMGVLGKLTLAVGGPILLILKQPDIKSAIVLPPMVFSMLFVSKLSGRFFAGALGAFLLLVGLVALDTWKYEKFMESHGYSYYEDRGVYEAQTWLRLPLDDYQRNRIVSFLGTGKIDDINWNQRQSLISVGSGGLTGKGWTEGTQARLGYLPRAVAHNDFIFSVIAEETGFLGSLTVLGLFGIVLFNGIRIAGLARDRFGTLLAIGVTVLFSVHVFVNIAMTIGLVPVTGIPLPFISYGGSFVLSCCLLQGLVQSVYRFRKDFA